jgi:hypothetical protein
MNGKDLLHCIASCVIVNGVWYVKTVSETQLNNCTGMVIPILVSFLFPVCWFGSRLYLYCEENWEK